MALVKCKDCGKEFSTDSKRCVHCGAKKPEKHIVAKLSLTFGALIAFWLAYEDGNNHDAAVPQSSSVESNNNQTVGVSNIPTNQAPTWHKDPHQADHDTKTLVAKLDANWRAQDGETPNQIFEHVQRVAHFYPRGWEATYSADGKEEGVVMSFATDPKASSDDTWPIGWDIAPNGAMVLAEGYAKPMELGWKALALSLIQDEVNEGLPNTNKKFLHDLSNLNFVKTPQGELGALLRKGRCKLLDPVNVDYSDTSGKDNPQKGDFWSVGVTVNCKISGPSYFTHEGVITFMKQGVRGVWEPQTFFAKRIASYPPGSWFDVPDLAEINAFAAVSKVVEESGLDSNERMLMMDCQADDRCRRQ